MKIENPNKDSDHKPRYKKCGVKYDLGIGTATKNPKYVNLNKELENKSHYKMRTKL